LAIEVDAADLEAGDWRSKLTPAHVLGSLTAWCAQYELPVRLAGDHDAAGRFVERFLYQAAREHAGIVDPYEQHHKRPLSEHVPDWHAALLAKGNTTQHADDAGRVLDFHAFRHTFITNLTRGGVHPKDAQTLARHSTIALTMDRYAHTARGSVAKALDALPDLSAPTAERERRRATGTYASKGVSNVCQKTLREGGKPSATDRTGVSRTARPNKQKTPGKSGFSASHSRFSSQAAVGFEPTNNGFAIRPLGPLGYAADTGGRRLKPAGSRLADRRRDTPLDDPRRAAYL